MSIVSVSFVIFIGLVVAGYYALPMRFRWMWLLAASVFFYVAYNPKLSVWLFVSVALIYTFGLWLDRLGASFDARIAAADKAGKKQLKKDKKAVLGYVAFFCAMIQLAIWVGFKFTGVFIGSLNGLLKCNFEIPNIIAPLGLSFYMLQAISYVIDIKRGTIKAQKNPFKLALWLGFFPQLIQGPIARYTDTSTQLFEGHRFDWDNLQFGAQLMLWGYFKKLVIANHASVVATTIFSAAFGKYLGCEYIIGIVFYAIQIYGDFSGGIDIISGVAQMLGVNLPRNFERPYFSTSLAEYWRRWHITLGQWFRDYIFYPLSISKLANRMGDHTRKWFGPRFGNILPTYCAMVLVWTANGIWHGAGMRYVAYGFYNGLMITLGQMFGDDLAKFADEKLHIDRTRFRWRVFQTLRTFVLVCIGRTFVKAPSVSAALRFYRSVFTKFNPWVFFDGSIYKYGLDRGKTNLLFLAVLVLFVVSVFQERGVRIRQKIAEQNIVLRWAFYYAAIFAVLLLGMYGPGYNAQDFIYQGF